jgi:hypothetical protein
LDPIILDTHFLLGRPGKNEITRFSCTILRRSNLKIRRRMDGYLG